VYLLVCRRSKMCLSICCCQLSVGDRFGVGQTATVHMVFIGQSKQRQLVQSLRAGSQVCRLH